MTKQYLIYDAACPMCLSFVKRLEWLKLTDKIQPTPNTDFDFGEALNQQINQKLGYEMQLVEPASGRILSGFDVMLEVLRNIPWLAWLAPIFALPIIYQTLRFFYRVVAYNRKILTPPNPNRIPCACDPPERGIDRYRVILWVILLAIFLFGIYIISLGKTLTMAITCLPLLLLFSLNSLLMLLKRQQLQMLSWLEQNIVAIAGYTFMFATFNYLVLESYLCKLPIATFVIVHKAGIYLFIIGLFAFLYFMCRSMYQRRKALGMPKQENKRWVNKTIWVLIALPLGYLVVIFASVFLLASIFTFGAGGPH